MIKLYFNNAWNADREIKPHLPSMTPLKQNSRLLFLLTFFCKGDWHLCHNHCKVVPQLPWHNSEPAVKHILFQQGHATKKYLLERLGETTVVPKFLYCFNNLVSKTNLSNFSWLQYVGWNGLMGQGTTVTTNKGWVRRNRSGVKVSIQFHKVWVHEVRTAEMAQIFRSLIM